MDWNLTWNAVEAISTAVAASVVVVTAIFAILQLGEMAKARKGAAFVSIYELLQREDVRQARGILIGLTGTPLGQWTTEDVHAAEKASRSYDTVAILAHRHVVDEDWIVREWRDSIVKCWEAAEVLVRKHRETRGQDYWDNFERLYTKAKEFTERQKARGLA